jgi:glucose-1-phosphate adenylyltransferase
MTNCIMMDRSPIGRGARLRRVVVDEGNDVPAFEAIGYDFERDRRRFLVSEAGIVVVPARRA